MTVDEKHLNLLKIFHYVVAGLSCLFSSFFIFHVYIGWSTMHSRGIFFDNPKSAPPPETGLMFFIMGIIAVSGGWLLGLLIAFSGRSIGKRKRYLFSLITAGIMCLACNPFGTVLGVFTFVVLLRPSVKALYQPAA